MAGRVVRVEGTAIVCTEPTEAFQDARASINFGTFYSGFQDPSPGALGREIHPGHRDDLTDAVLTMYNLRKTNSEVSSISAIVERSHAQR